MDCVIVHDLFLNETANYAHVFLPGSTFLEKDGTFTNAERRINRVRKVMAPKNGYADWEITQMLANAMGGGWHYTHPAQIMEEIAATTPSFTGVTYDLLEEGLGPVAVQRQRPRRLADHACGRFRARQGAVHRHRIRGDRREDRPALSACC
jgi:predicted molibdopterin-dependent oxidoreductase YjgC